MNRPSYLPGPVGSAPAEIVIEVRNRVAKRQRALKIARRHGDRAIAREMNLTEKMVRAIADHRAYKWVR